MCGIMAYIGHAQAWPLIVTGLKRLEYRGYDSAGIATVDAAGELRLARAVGLLNRLEEQQPQGLPGLRGIGHTRWATHGQVTVENCHPHLDPSGALAIVHNGIIDNVEELLARWPCAADRLRGQTDTEILISCIAQALKGMPEPEHPQALLGAVRQVLELVRGTAALVVLDKRREELVVARLGSPVVLGVSDEAAYAASDAQALLPFTDRVIHLEDGDIARLGVKLLEIVNLDQATRQRRIARIELDTASLGQGEDAGGAYEHLFLKEIFDQPEALDRAMRGRLDHQLSSARLDELDPLKGALRGLSRVCLFGCGTSLYAGQLGRYMLEAHARIPSVAEDAAELAGLNPVHDPSALYIGLSQSGETADALSLLRELELRDAHTLTITNVVGNSMARQAKANLYVHAGFERSVASTKSFTAQALVLSLLTLKLARQRGLMPSQGALWLKALAQLPQLTHEALLSYQPIIRALAQEHAQAKYTMFVGRGVSSVVAAEGALKLKELSYMPCDGLSGAQMKHGPIALIEPNTPVWAISPPDHTRERMLGNLNELKARGAKLMVIADAQDRQIAQLADVLIPLPSMAHELISPILSVLPLQLYAYEVAKALGRSVDKPRNLAKAVTVE